MEEDSGPPPRPQSSVLSDSAIDFDLMDEILSGDCWVETPNYSDLLQSVASPSTSPFSSSPLFPFLDTSNHGSNAFFFETDNQEAEDPTSNELGTGNSGYEPRSNWLVRPRGPIAPVKDRLQNALRFIKESQSGGDVLVQIWVPILQQGRHYLTTLGQPYSLDDNSQSLVNYRSVSTGYWFSAEDDSRESVGLPGRVFLGKLPEWTPDVRYFSSDEYPRVVDAQRFNVSGSIALPVFERDSQTCLGVVEVVLTTQKSKYRSDLENICNALQAVDLRSSNVLNVPRVKASNTSYHAALPEIREVLKAVCETHSLPLAQTWIPCFQQGKRGSRHSSENYKDCVSPIDAACHVKDPSMLGFQEACSEHHLFRGQGVVGKAFTTNQPCFSPDVTSFMKTEYPLSHHAKLFHLRSAVAIHLRSVYTGNADFVLEFFLPVDCIGSEEQKMMLNSLSITIQQVCQSLRVVNSKELEDEAMFEVDDSYPTEHLLDESVSEGDQRPDGNIISSQPPSIGNSREVPSWIANFMEVKEKDGSNAPPSIPVEFSKQEQIQVTMNRDATNAPSRRTFSEFKQHKQKIADRIDSVPSEPRFLQARKTIDKRRAKSEKTVSLQVLRQYFAGSLKDAAKNIGVCPTTLKRICRQHGITRWPSRKIKKVGHSLKKLQGVIDSVQGAEGTFQFSSVYENFSKVSSTDNELVRKQTDQPDCSNTVQQQEGRFSPHTSASQTLSSSSCSQSSNSSLGCTSGSKQSIHASELVIKQEAFAEENQIVKLKRGKSEVKLQRLSQERTPYLVRSQSHQTLTRHPSLGNPSQLQNKRPDLFKVKAVFGEEKVRFTLQPTWCFQELKQEMMKRFNISNVVSIDLKYLDDDSEWVLLTCDEDLQECIDVYKSSSGRTIKISVHHSVPRASFSFPVLS